MSTTYTTDPYQGEPRQGDFTHFTATREPSHSVLVGYSFWILGFTGAHRFFFGKPLTGILWFFTGGLLLIGWIVDLFLVPQMSQEADARFPQGKYDYNLAWLLLVFLGFFGIHRFYLGKYITGAIYLVTGGLFGIGYVYDILTLNDQIAEQQY
jgi:TM2 domain-containing membrane protein YozV